MEVLEYGLCGLREIRLIKEERVIGEFNGSTIEDFATSYTIQIRIPYLLFWHKWISLANWGVLDNVNLDKADVERNLLIAKMSAKALYNKMIKYGGFQNSSK
jgi:hypothetical protein|nr:MAG TPA: hypothetical protein [Crassvirales sp.]